MSGVGVGLIGSGFMGKCHALAYGAVKAVFGDVPTPRLELLCDTPPDKASAMAEQFGFARATGDWRALATDPAVEDVNSGVTSPAAVGVCRGVSPCGEGGADCPVNRCVTCRPSRCYVLDHGTDRRPSLGMNGKECAISQYFDLAELVRVGNRLCGLPWVRGGHRFHCPPGRR